MKLIMICKYSQLGLVGEGQRSIRACECRKSVSPLFGAWTKVISFHYLDERISLRARSADAAGTTR